MHKSEILLSLSNFAVVPFVANFKGSPFVELAATYYEFPVGLAISYLLFCFIGYKMIRFQRALDLQMYNLLWNAALCVVSFAGMCRTLPLLLSVIYAPTPSLRESLCVFGSSYSDGPGAFWIVVFVLCRIFQLLDTMFIILRKKPLPVVHWFQHVTMVLYCWDGFATRSPTLVFIAGANYMLNAMMYGSWCLVALKLKVVNLSAVPLMITVMQICESVMGLGLCCVSLHHIMGGATCGSPRNTIAGIMIYGSILFLQGSLEWNKYLMAVRLKNRKVSVSFVGAEYFNNARTEYYIRQERSKLGAFAETKKYQ
jgi:elongation of very long chain fatty acids protein 6